MDRIKDIAINVAEILFAVVFIASGVQNILADPVVLDTVFHALLGQTALYFYGVIFLITGLALLLAKIQKIKSLHKYSLLSMYLCSFYSVALITLVIGPTLQVIPTLVMGVSCALLWLRWKFATEYIDYKKYRYPKLRQ